MQDWSALGLVSDFLFVDADAPTSALGSSCASIAGGVATAGRLSTILAERAQTPAVRVVCLSQLADGFSSIGPNQGGRFRQEVRNALPEAVLTWIHTIAVAVPESWPYVPEDDLAWVGAHNVVLAPENSQSPNSGVAPLGAHERLQPVGLTHQTAALCSAVGLWADEPRCFFEGDSTVGGGQVVAIRTYTRHLALEGMRSEILSRLVDVTDGYPIPATADARAQVVADEAAAGAAMASAVLGQERHSDVRPGVRAGVAAAPHAPLKFFEALRMFLRFFTGALRGAPRALHDEVSGKVAGAAQRVFLGGTDSAHVMTVNGVRGIRPDGTVAPRDELDQDIGTLQAEMQGASGAVPPERQEYPDLWKDFVTGALTLLDGSHRNQALEPQRIGSGVAVVNQPLAVVADPEEPYRVPEQLRAAVGVATITPYDDDLASTTIQMLEQRIQDRPDEASFLASTRDELRAWSDERSRSYVGSFGRQLAVDLNQVRAEVVRYANDLAGKPGGDAQSEELDRAQNSLAWTLLGFVGFCLVLIVGVAWLAQADTVSWKFALVAIPVILLFWLLVSTGIFHRRQEQVLRVLRLREHAVNETATLKANLGAALVDLRRLQSVYRQYLSWAQALGAFVRAPLGRFEATADADAALGEGFCLNHRFGVAVPAPAVLEEASRQLESRLFTVGWLSDAWDRYVADLPEFRDRHLVEADPELLYTDRPVAETSVLAQWSDAVVAADRTDAAGEIRERLAEVFDSETEQTFDRLLSSVRARSPLGEHSDLRRADFVAGLQNIVEHEAGNRNFSQTMFAEVPETAEPWQVADVLVSGGRGEVRPLIVTERTKVFGPRDLAFGQQRETVVDGLAQDAQSTSIPPQV